MSQAADDPAVRASLSALFRSPAPAAEVTELAGDASTRRYFRIRLGPGSPIPSVVLMRYPDEVPPGEELPFVNVHRYLRKAEVPVPEIYLSDPEAKLLLLEDAGDTTLEHAFAEAPSAEEVLPLYEMCIEILVRIQNGGTKGLDGGAIPLRHAFDVPKFVWEIDFFFEHAVRGFGGIVLTDREERAIEDIFLPLLEELCGLPRVLAHRDYHSRNVMVMPGPTKGPAVLRILDFQDARMGNVFYDLASLLRDSYVTLPEKAVEHLCYVYRHASPKDLLAMAGDRSRFAYRHDLSALQRNVKAIGTFGNQAHARGKTFYLKFIPRTVAHIAANVARNPELRGLGRKLLPLLEALAAKASAEYAP